MKTENETKVNKYKSRISLEKVPTWQILGAYLENNDRSKFLEKSGK
mgnify:CR=1 FL=1